MTETFEEIRHFPQELLWHETSVLLTEFLRMKMLRWLLESPGHSTSQHQEEQWYHDSPLQSLSIEYSLYV